KQRLAARLHAEAHIHDVHSVPNTPFNAEDNIRDVSRALMVERLDRMDDGARCDADHAVEPVRGGDRAGDMRPVPVVVMRQHAAGQQIDAAGQRVTEIGMAEVDAGIDDADLDAMSGRRAPCRRRSDRLHAPRNALFEGGRLADGAVHVDPGVGLDPDTGSEPGGQLAGGQPAGDALDERHLADGPRSGAGVCSCTLRHCPDEPPVIAPFPEPQNPAHRLPVGSGLRALLQPSENAGAVQFWRPSRVEHAALYYEIGYSAA